MTDSDPIDLLKTMVLYEHYDSDGYLLNVVSDSTTVILEMGEVLTKRQWMTKDLPDNAHRDNADWRIR